MEAKEFIRKKIEDNDIKKIWLARRLGVSRQSINIYLSPNSKNKGLNIGTFLRLCDSLGYRIVAIPKGKQMPTSAVEINE